MILSTFLILLGFILAVSSNWAFGYFGLSCFEQLVYHMKVPLEGTNTEFVFDWFRICLKKAIIYTAICFIPSCFILFYKEFEGYENVLKESELDLIDLFLGERYE